MNNLPDEREERDKQIATLLRERLPIEEIKRRLRTSYRAVVRVRDTEGIFVPPYRRSRAELDKAEAKAVEMLWAGATQREIYTELRVDPNVQARLRKLHKIPVRRWGGKRPSQGQGDAAQ